MLFKPCSVLLSDLPAIGSAPTRFNLVHVTNTVRAEPVEALSFPFGREEGQGFDKLSPNGAGE